MGHSADFKPWRGNYDRLSDVEKRHGRSCVLLAGLQAVPVFVAGPDAHVFLLLSASVADASIELSVVDLGLNFDYFNAFSRLGRRESRRRQQVVGLIRTPVSAAGDFDAGGSDAFGQSSLYLQS